MAEVVATLTEADDGRTVELRVGDLLELHLHENASTGYHWSFDALDAAVVTVRDDGYVSRSQAVGSGGDRRWTLAMKAPATTRIGLELRRPWEKDVPPAKAFALTLIIRS